MAQQINDNFSITAPKLVDNRSHKVVNGEAVPYDSINEALSTVLKPYRSIGLSVIIHDIGENKVFWFKDGTDDNNLVEYNTSTVKQMDQVPTPGHLGYAFSSDGAYNFFQTKVDKIDGKSLSTNDYTSPEKNTVNGASLHMANTNNPHNVTKAQVGLGNVPNVDATNPVNIVQTTNYRFVTDSQIATWNTGSGSVTVDQVPTSGHTTQVISSAGVYNSLQVKVDKITGKGLSTNDYDNTAQAKVASIDQVYSLTEKNKLAAISGTNTGNETTTSINTLYGYTPANAATLSSHTGNTSNPHSTTKAQVGLGNVPNIDTTNPANIVQTASFRFVTDTEKATWNAGGGGGSSIDDSASSTTTTYSSSKVVTLLAGKVPTTLTINSYPLSGNVTILKADVGLGNVLNVDATNPSNITQSASFRFTTDTEKATWNAKQSQLVSGTNIKTVGGISLVGSGDVPAATINDTTAGSTTVYSSSKVTTLLAGKAATVHSHAPTDIITDSTHRFVTDTQITTWNANSGTTLDQTPTSGNTTNALSSDGAYIALGNKVDKTTTVNGKALSASITLSKTDVGLSNVTNVNTSVTDNITEGTTNLFYTNVRAAAAAPVQSVSGRTGSVTLTKADVGLSNVVNLDTSNPANITQTTNYRFVTDAQIATFGASGASDYWTSVKASGAAGDGTTDDTTAFVSALGSNRIVYLPVGTYKLTSTISLTNITNLRIVGSKNSKLTSTTLKTLLLMTNCTNIEITDVTFESTLNEVGNAADTVNGLVKINGATSTLLARNSFTAANTSTDGIKVLVDDTHKVTKLTITDNDFSNLGQRGVSIITTSFTNQNLNSVKIARNTFNNTGNKVTLNGQAILVRCYANSVNISNNEITDANTTAIEADGVFGLTIDSNWMTDVNRAFVPFSVRNQSSGKTTTGLVLVNNNINVQDVEDDSIYLGNVTEFNVSGNYFRSGVLSIQGNNGTVTGNTIISNDTRALYLVTPSNSNYFSGNVVDNTGATGPLEPIRTDGSGVVNNIFCNNQYRTAGGNNPYAFGSGATDNVFVNQF